MKLIKKIIILIILASVVIWAINPNAVMKRVFPLKYEEYIEKYSEEYSLSKYLVMGVIRAESNFEPSAHSGKARGLMQLTDETAQWTAEKLGEDYFEDMVTDPETNIEMGCFYLSYLIDLYQNTETALAAYNAGMGNVSDWLKTSDYSKDGKTLFYIPFEETDKYVKRVTRLTAVYEKIY